VLVIVNELDERRFQKMSKSAISIEQLLKVRICVCKMRRGVILNYDGTLYRNGDICWGIEESIKVSPIFDIKGCPAGRSHVAGPSLKLASLAIVDNILKLLDDLAHPFVRYLSSFAQQFVSILPLGIRSSSEKATGEIN
jgi:Ni,Fe-hydrogenase I small subunit